MYHEQKMLIPVIILIYQTVLNSEVFLTSFEIIIDVHLQHTLLWESVRKIFAKYITKHSKPYSQPKKLYQFLTNLIILANIPTPSRVKHHIEKNLTTSCFRTWLQRDWSTGQGFPQGRVLVVIPPLPKKLACTPMFPRCFTQKVSLPNKSTTNRKL